MIKKKPSTLTNTHTQGPNEQTGALIIYVLWPSDTPQWRDKAQTDKEETKTENSFQADPTEPEGRGERRVWLQSRQDEIWALGMTTFA